MATQPQKVKNMAKDSDKNELQTTVLQSDMGKTHIHREVVAKIAGLAVREVEGVHSLVPFGTGQRISSLAYSVSGNDMKDLGVVVEVGEFEAAVDVRIITAYGVSIPEVARAIQNNVSSRIKTMTGLKVKEINIEVVDLYFAQDEKVKEPELVAEPRVR